MYLLNRPGIVSIVNYTYFQLWNNLGLKVGENIAIYGVYYYNLVFFLFACAHWLPMYYFGYYHLQQPIYCF